ncbi:MAG: PQQ-binding-like beta-propeller repeat protein [Solirubrobacterales bacterium]
MADSPKSEGGGPAFPQPPPIRQRWWQDPRKLWAAIGGGVLLVAAVAFAAYQLFKPPDDVSRGDEVPFKQEKRQRVVKTTNWPMFGLDRARTRWLPANRVKPPYKELWKHGGKPLIEFPPIFVKAGGLCEKRTKLGCGGRLFYVDNNGFAYSLDADTGKVIWHRRIAELNASSPAYSRGRLFIVNLAPGQILSLDAATGKTIWKRSLPGRSESSPVVVGKRVFFGDEDGNLRAFSTGDGHTIWTTPLAGAIKAGPAYRHGLLYVGDYGGEMSAVRARNGEIEWQAGSLGLSFSRTGEFYSTPAVAFGRVYSGNNDGRVYSFDEKTGELAWTQSTGGYVYPGPAVADTPQTPPSVYIGSYDGNIYALDAKTGVERWSRSLGGPVIGSLSVIGKTVYIATFEGTTTYGFKLTNGQRKFRFKTGAYMPVISDGRRIYLTGYSSIYALQPVKHKPKPQKGGGAGGSAGSGTDSGQAP